MNLIAKLHKLAELNSSRQLQWLGFQRDRLVTATIRRWRLRRCGANTIVQAPLFWTPEFIELGSGVLIWAGARIEGIDEHDGVRYTPTIRLGNGVSLQQGCHITATGTIDIGANTTISVNVLITDNDHGYEMLGTNVLQQPLRVCTTSIGNNCFIGAGARILAGTLLGNQCIVGTNSVVRGVFPDNCVLSGNPARIVKRFDAETGRWLKTNAEGVFLE